MMDRATLAAGMAEAMGGPLATPAQIERTRDQLAALPTGPDVTIYNHGSIWAFTPLSDAGGDWIADNVDEESAIWQGRALMVEARFAFDLAQGMQADGLELERGGSVYD